MMDRLDPAIINRIRAQSDVGPDSITHAHHIPTPREALAEETLDGTQSPTLQEKKSPRLVQLFRSAVRGVKGEEYDSSTET